MLALLVLLVLPPARFLYSKQLTTEQQKRTLRELQEYEWEQKLPIYIPISPGKNHYVWSKNIILFTPKLACEHVITSVACGNRHLCSIFVCHFGVYFQENWKIIFKIWPPKIAKNRLSSHRPNHAHWQSFSMILQKFLAVYI